jgi:site-specific DNA-methyltransferase (adenine-specific)
MFCGDSAVELLKIKDNSVDMLCSDPPYGYSFMNKGWDQVLPDTEIWRQSYRVLKPGAFITVMAAPRTDVLWRISRDLEEAGFDLSFSNIEWVYHSGFPKATDISKSLDKRKGRIGYDLSNIKNQLKDLYKQSGKTFAKIDEECGFKATGYLRITSRDDDGWGEALPTEEKWRTISEVIGATEEIYETYKSYFEEAEREIIGQKTSGIGKAFTEDGWGSGSDEVDITIASTDVAKKYEGSKAGFQPKPAREIIIVGMKPFSEGSYVDKVLNFEALPDNVKMTYPLIQTPKPSKKEKDFGIGENIPLKQRAWLSPQSRTTSEDYTKTSAGHERWLTQPKRNSHPTVKPIKLMSYLITLFTRPGDWILDPFGGSGTTGLACKLLDRNHIYIDFTEEYYDIAQERLQVSKEDLKKLLKEKISNGQQELF